MSRLLSIGAELQSTTNGMEWDTTSASGGSVTIDTTTKRSGSASIKFVSNAAGSNYIEHQYSASGVVTFSRAYVYFTAFPTDATGAIIQHINSGGTVIACIAITTAGKLRLYDGNIAGTQRGADSAALSLNTWYRVELTTNNGAGTEIDARLDGSSFASGAMTSATNAQQIDFGFADWQANAVMYMDDLAVNDTSGSAQTSWCGDGKIIHQKPGSAGDSAGFVRQGSDSGANWSQVNDTTPNDITAYVNSPTLNAEDLHNTVDSGIGASDTVTLVSVGVRFRRNNNTASPQFKVEIEKTASGTISQGSAIIPNSTTWRTNANAAPRVYTLTAYTDPDGAAWTQTTLDSMQIGYKLTTTGGTTRIDVTTVWALVEYVPVNDYSINVSDSVSVTESKQLEVNSFVNKSDSVTVSESVKVEINSDVNKSDSVTVTENVQRLLESYINKSESVSVQDTPILLIPELYLNVSDSATVTESVQRVLESFVNKSDSTSVTESVSLDVGNNVSVSDSVSVAESTKQELNSFANKSESVTVSENLSLLIPDLYVNVSDSISVTESLKAELNGFISVSEAVSVTENIVRELNSFINVSDSTSLTESVVRVLESFINKSDSVSVAESVSVSIAATSDLSISVSDSVSVTESVQRLVENFVSVSDSTTVTEALQRMVESYINKSESVSVTESLQRLLESNVSVSDSLTVNESIVRLVTGSIVISETVAISENVQVQIPSLFVSLTDSVSVAEAISVEIEGNETISYRLLPQRRIRLGPRQLGFSLPKRGPRQSNFRSKRYRP